jgi:hypothetical protein
VGITDFGMTESTKTQLNHGSVVEDLSQGIRMRHCVLQMRHEHEIAGLVPVVVNSMVIDVTKNGSGSQPIRRVIGINKFAHFVHQGHTGIIVGRKISLKNRF